MTKNKKKKGFVNGNKEVGLGDRVQEAGCSWEEAINRLRSFFFDKAKKAVGVPRTCSWRKRMLEVD